MTEADHAQVLSDIAREGLITPSGGIAPSHDGTGRVHAANAAAEALSELTFSHCR